MAPDPLAIVLVARNAATFIEGAIAQARSVEREFGARVVAIDGHSDDGTFEALSAQAGWTVRRQREPGLAAARNEAIAIANAALIAFLDVDDEWLPGKIGAQLAQLHESPRTEVSSCLLRKVGPGVEPRDAEALHHALTPSGCVIRRTAFEKVGPFDARYRIACDHAWFIRARRLGIAIDVLPRCLLHKRIHERNLSHDRGLYRRELLEILRSHD